MHDSIATAQKNNIQNCITTTGSRRTIQQNQFSQASNLLVCSAERIFRTIDDTRPHDIGIEDLVD